MLTEDDLRRINTRKGFIQLIESRNVDLEEVRRTLLYEEELRQLQVELVRPQRWVQADGQRIAILVEGKAAAPIRRAPAESAQAVEISPVDEKAQELRDSYTRYKEEIFSKTHTTFCPGISLNASDKQVARLESLRYMLNLLPYKGKEEALVRLAPNPNVVIRFHRQMAELDF